MELSLIPDECRAITSKGWAVPVSMFLQTHMHPQEQPLYCFLSMQLNTKSCHSQIIMRHCFPLENDELSNQNAVWEYVDAYCHLGQNFPVLKCILCVLLKINYAVLKSKILWFNKHFFQQKVSLLDNLQMFGLVLIQNCFTLSLQWQKFL